MFELAWGWNRSNTISVFWLNANDTNSHHPDQSQELGLWHIQRGPTKWPANPIKPTYTISWAKTRVPHTNSYKQIKYTTSTGEKKNLSGSSEARIQYATAAQSSTTAIQKKQNIVSKRSERYQRWIIPWLSYRGDHISLAGSNGNQCTINRLVEFINAKWKQNPTILTILSRTHHPWTWFLQVEAPAVRGTQDHLSSDSRPVVAPRRLVEGSLGQVVDRLIKRITDNN